MKNYIAHIESVSPYTQSKHVITPKLEKEKADDFERRTWRDRIHADENGEVFIPAMALKNCFSEAAKYLSLRIEGSGKSTYTKHFEAGLLIPQNIPLGIMRDNVAGVELFLNADGKRGSGTRVMRIMPTIMSWYAEFPIVVLDETITADVLKYHIEQAGAFIGIGQHRPRNNGVNGRFVLKSLKEI